MKTIILSLFFLFTLTISTVMVAAQDEDRYDVIAEFISLGRGASKEVKADWQLAQTFVTPSDQDSYWVTHVRLYLYSENAEGPVIISIRESDGDNIGKTDLTHGTISASQIRIQQWYRIQMINPYELESGKQYAIVVSAPDVTGNVYPLYELNHNKQYVEGAMYYSQFSGLWLKQQIDMPFQILTDTTVIPEFPAAGILMFITAIAAVLAISKKSQGIQVG
jgi:hypothetical protein